MTQEEVVMWETEHKDDILGWVAEFKWEQEKVIEKIVSFNMKDKSIVRFFIKT